MSLGWKIYVKYNKREVRRVASNRLHQKLKYVSAICFGIPHPVPAGACAVYVYDSYNSVTNTFESGARRRRCVEMSYLYGGPLVGWKTYSC